MAFIQLGEEFRSSLVRKPTLVNGILRPCCADARNREPWEQQPDKPERRGDLHIERCRVCDRRHFYLSADPGKIFSQGVALR